MKITKNIDLNEVIDLLLSNHFTYKSKTELSDVRKIDHHQQSRFEKYKFKHDTEEIFVIIWTEGSHSPMSQNQINAIKILITNSEEGGDFEKYKPYKLSSGKNFAKRFFKLIPEITLYNNEQVILKEAIKNRRNSALAELNLIFLNNATVEVPSFSDEVIHVKYKGYSWQLYIKDFLNQGIEGITVSLNLGSQKNDINIMDAKKIIDILDK